MQDTQALYDFVPMPERKPLKWPNGKRLALMITLNLEYWELTQDHDGAYFPGGPSINERLLPARIPDFNNHSWREYGHRVGIWRLYDIFDEAKVPASCTVNGILCERHPQIVTAAAKRGWELIAHNYIQTEFLVNYRDDRAKEREVIKRVLDLIEKTTGKRPKGWLSSSLRCTVNTSDICKELGLTYHCDYMNDEQPYLINTAHGPLVSIPYTQEANDIGMFLRRNLTADRGIRIVEGRVRRALSLKREQRPHHEHRPASAHHRPRLPRPRHPRISGLCEEIRRRVVGHPRGDRGLVSEEPQAAISVKLSLLRALRFALRHGRRLQRHAGSTR